MAGGSSHKASGLLNQSFLKDRKRLAWSILSILKNNIVSNMVLYEMVVVQEFELIFIAFIFASS